jgi:hypothetical protein
MIPKYAAQPLLILIKKMYYTREGEGEREAILVFVVDVIIILSIFFSVK